VAALAVDALSVPFAGFFSVDDSRLYANLQPASSAGVAFHRRLTVLAANMTRCHVVVPAVPWRVRALSMVQTGSSWVVTTAAGVGGKVGLGATVGAGDDAGFVVDGAAAV
jgi:hypothetical protein